MTALRLRDDRTDDDRTAMTRSDRYLRLVYWAQRRYGWRDGYGQLRYATMHGIVPSRYTVIEDLAAAAFLGCRRRLPGWSLDLAATDILPRKEQDWRREQARANNLREAA